jgi:uncharacterized membrane protein YdjX (TVP38/TMEM64 family)
MLAKHALKRFAPLAVLVTGLLVFFYFDLGRFLSFDVLKANREFVLQWTHDHFFLALLSFFLIYTIAVAVSIPGATFLTLASGFLFGTILGTVVAVTSATIGALIVFLAVRTALEPWLAKKTGRWVEKMRQGFQQGAFQYLLILRLVPLFPFWVVNIVPGLLGVSVSTYFITTFLGIMPGTFVYVLLGNGLGYLFDRDQTPNLAIIFEPQVLIPLLALAVLSCIPMLYKKFIRTPK